MAAPILILNVIEPCDMNEGIKYFFLIFKINSKIESFAEFEDLAFSITVAADEESE